MIAEYMIRRYLLACPAQVETLNFMAAKIWGDTILFDIIERVLKTSIDTSSLKILSEDIAAFDLVNQLKFNSDTQSKIVWQSNQKSYAVLAVVDCIRHLNFTIEISYRDFLIELDSKDLFEEIKYEKFS